VKLGSIVFAGLILTVGLVYEGMALYMPRGSLSYPGPGFFPLAIGVFLIVTALGCLLQEFLPRKRGVGLSVSPLPNQDSASPGDRNVKKTFQLMAVMIGYILALKPLGFPIHLRLPGGRDPHLRLSPVGSHPGHGGLHRGHLLHFVRPLA
jgi:hypothetical protein